MKKPQNTSNVAEVSDRKRRDFLSLSALAAATFLLSRDGRASTLPNQDNDRAIPDEVSAADSLALYTNLLDEVRRLVLQRDAKTILVAKIEASDWLRETTAKARELSATFAAGATTTTAQQAQLRSFLSEVDFGGREIFNGLVEMRQKPLDEIKRLDVNFDSIRADLTAASDAIKRADATAAKAGIESAVNKLNRYASAGLDAVSKTFEEEYRVSLITPSRLQALLQTVRDSIGTPPPRDGDFNHALPSAATVPPALQSGITTVLRTKLNPSSFLQRGIGYAVTFPILMRVSDKNNRIKLLTDALRLVPPGLRNPLLTELATELANLN